MKPARSRIRTGRGWVTTRVHYAASEVDLYRLYEQTDYLASHPSLIQERIVGPGVGIFGCSTGAPARRLRAPAAAREASLGRRERPVREHPVARRLRDDASRLLGPLGWHGVAMIEYKQDERTGTGT